VRGATGPLAARPEIGLDDWGGRPGSTLDPLPACAGQAGRGRSGFLMSPAALRGDNSRSHHPVSIFDSLRKNRCNRLPAGYNTAVWDRANPREPPPEKLGNNSCGWRAIPLLGSTAVAMSRL